MSHYQRRVFDKGKKLQKKIMLMYNKENIYRNYLNLKKTYYLVNVFYAKFKGGYFKIISLIQPFKFLILLVDDG